MLKRLAEAGWITYKPGHGARLTEHGVAAARTVIRRHRLLELFLTRVLGLDWSEVDAEADAVEHAISPRLEQARPHGPSVSCLSKAGCSSLAWQVRSVLSAARPCAGRAMVSLFCL